MRKALVVGIDHYDFINKLGGCVHDAQLIAALLECDEDGKRNFDVQSLCAPASGQVAITRRQLKQAIIKLFADDSEIALLYFAGHGAVESTGGYLCTSDVESVDDGLALSEVMTIAQQSEAQNKVIILDSCHSAAAGNSFDNAVAILPEGMTILAASNVHQTAKEQDGGGVFTALLADALDGAAANLVGEVTLGSVYAHIDKSLGAWDQRPVFKTNVKRFMCLRRTEPAIGWNDLKLLSKHFPSDDHEVLLDPSFEPEMRGRPDGVVPPDPANCRSFAALQKFYKVNLVEPVGTSHLWHAAMESKSCRLTRLGMFYRSLAASGRL